MVRFTKCLVAVVALGFVVGSACKKADNASAGGGGATGDDVALIPADSEVVFGLNFAQLQQSALWKQYSPKIMAKMSDKLTQFQAACGFDPMTSFKSMTMGMKNVGAGNGAKPDGVMVIHGPDKAKVMACMDKYKAEAAKDGTELTVDGDVVLVKDTKDNQTAAMTFVNDTTMIATIGALGTKDGVKAAAKGSNGLKSSQMFNDLFGKINTGDSFWVMVNGNSPLLDKASMIGKPKAMYGSLNITDGLSVDFHVKAASPDEAKSLVDMAKAQTDSPQVKQMVDKIEVSNAGDDAHFVVAMSAQKLQALVGMFGGMMGMMGGGAGGGGTP
ncbi:MAG TPA: hypothetical protein VGG28_14635 [Kofleriaceae bacterium]|jgi:hypothetical protein